MALSRAKVWGNEVLSATDLNAEFDNILNNAASLISPLGGALDWDGYAHTLDAAGVTSAQSTATIGWSFTPGNKAGTPGTTGGVTNYAASTWTDNNTAASGTAASWVGHAFQRPTVAASNATVTTTNAATVYIANAPLAGTNETLTNPWALWVDAGNVRFDDNISWLSGTSFKGTLDHANTADRTYTVGDFTGRLANYVEMSKQTLTGTSVDFTSIPSGVHTIVLVLDGASLSATGDLLIQIGDSGGIETTSYNGGSAVTGGTTVAFTSGFRSTSNSAAAVWYVMFHLKLYENSSNTWGCSFVGGIGGGTNATYGAGTKSLSATLDRVRVTATGGDSFDAGTANIFYLG